VTVWPKSFLFIQHSPLVQSFRLSLLPLGYVKETFQHGDGWVSLKNVWDLKDVPRT